MLIALASTAISLFCGLFAGYALSRLKFPFAGSLGTGIFITYLVPQTLLFIPLADIIRNFKLGDTPWALILTYPTFLIPFCTWLMMGYFKSIPKELEECARIDGASRWKAMVYIIFPVAIPGILSAGIFAFTLSWNEFIYALVFLSSPEQKTVPVGVTSELVRGDVFYWGPLMAGALLGSIPVAFVYSFFVEHYVSGITGSVKGDIASRRLTAECALREGACNRWEAGESVWRRSSSKTSTSSMTGARRQRREPGDPRQGVRRAGRPVGLRQDDDPAHGGGARNHQLRRHLDRRHRWSTTWRRWTATSPWCSRTTRSTRT